MLVTRRELLAAAAAAASPIAGAALAEPPFPSITSGRPGEQRRLYTGARMGRFAWSASDHGRDVLGDPLGGVYVPGSDDPSGERGAWVRTEAEPVRPEWFGGKGDGIANDTAALAATARYVTARGGGTVALRPVTYLVGEQTLTGRRGAGAAYVEARVMEFVGCPRDVVLQGNGARLRCVAGLRYGTFDPVTGAPTAHPMPFRDDDELARPYRYMVLFRGCGGAIDVSDLELDGACETLILGGTYGDTGRQIPGIGLALFDNSGPEHVRDLYSHHHALDGVKIDGINDPRGARPRRLLERVRSEYNGRQGCSIVGGQGYGFVDCVFAHTSRANIVSKPRGGVDIEAQGKKQVRDLSFLRCRFVDNGGPGLVADQGDGRGALFRDCLFVGTTNWSAWPKKPDFVFQRCRFVGAIVNCYGGGTPDEAARFEDCTFTDDPAASPTSATYAGRDGQGTIADLSRSGPTRFTRCTFRLVAGATLPATRSAIYRDCTMSQRSPRRANPKGSYVGRNRITGNVDVTQSRIAGELIVNGTRVPPTPA